MDKPTRVAGSDDSDDRGPSDSASAEGIGATGVFESVKSPETLDGPRARWEEEIVRKPAPVTEVGNARPSPIVEPLAEPVVHKVVLGGGHSTDSTQLLSRMRKASAEKAPQVRTPPSNEAGDKAGTSGADTTGRDQSGPGFTQLLRSLGADSPAPAGSAKPNLASSAYPPTQRDLFLSDPSSTGTTQASERDSDPLVTAKHTADSSGSEAAAGGAKPSEPGEFTKLLRATQYGSTDSHVFAMPDAVAGKGPEGSGTARSASSSSGNQPGEFTKLLSSLGGSAAPSSTPATYEPEMGHSSRGSGGSFTEMLAMEQKSAPIESEIFGDRKPATDHFNFDRPIPQHNPPAASQGPFASRELVDVQPDAQGPQGANPGITRLIQMLDSPSKSPSPVVEPPPASPAGQAGPGAWTRTFTSLDDSNEQPGATAGQVPYRPVSQERPGSAAAAIGPGKETSGRFNERVAPASPPLSGSAGPSEYTRIIDASRMRESAMASGHSAEAALQRPAAPAAPPQVQVQMPSYPISVSPGMVGMQGMGNLPHVGGVGSGQPLHVPGYPMNIGPQGGSISVMGGSVSVTPGMHVPAIPPASAPLAPPAKQAATGMGKLQQYVPLLLIVIIFLLIGLLVTVVFLLKR